MTNQMWATYGKNMAQLTMTNLDVNQIWSTDVSANVAHLSQNISGPGLAKIRLTGTGSSGCEPKAAHV